MRPDLRRLKSREIVEMRKVDNDRITLTRGDTLPIDLTLCYRDGSEYVYESGDTIRFAISEGYESELNYHLIYEQEFSAETLSFVMPAEETKKLRYKTYNYDIQLTLANGYVDTVVSSQLTVNGEVA